MYENEEKACDVCQHQGIVPGLLCYTFYDCSNSDQRVDTAGQYLGLSFCEQPTISRSRIYKPSESQPQSQ